MKRYRIPILLLAVAAVAAAARAQGDAPVDASRAAGAPKVSPPAAAQGEAGDGTGIVRPKGYRPRPAPSAGPADGSQLNDRLCHLEPAGDTNWYAVRFEDEPNAPHEVSRLVLPGDLLEQVEALATQEPRPLLRICGEMMRYRGKPFILLTEVVVSPPAPRAGPASRPATVDPASGQNRTDGSSGAQPGAAMPQPGATVPQTGAAEPNAARAAAGTPASRPTAADEAAGAEDILNVLSQHRPGRPVLIPVLPPREPEDQQQSVAPLPPDKPLLSTRGSMVVNRVVRILPEEKGGWWAVHFAGDNTLREPPIRLMPCALLEKAEKDVAAARGRAIRFNVSGYVTTYKGRRYMLLRKVLEAKDTGPF